LIFRRFDPIILDAFINDHVPEHLVTREFLQETRALLSPEAPNAICVRHAGFFGGFAPLPPVICAARSFDYSRWRAAVS